MKVGDIVTIKNKAGILKIRITKELDFRDVARCVGDDKLPTLYRPRVEYHKGPYDEHLVTLCDESGSLPFNIYLLHIQGYSDVSPKCYLSICDDTEESVFETMY